MRKSLAPFDVRHNFSLSGVGELPVGDGMTGFAEKLLGGWQLGGILSLSTGNPITIDIQTRSDMDQLGIAQDTAALAGRARVELVSVKGKIFPLTDTSTNIRETFREIPS
jgi:hypothetical protein